MSFSAPRAPRASQTGVSIVADTRQLSRLARDLRRASPDAWKALRVALRVAAEPVAQEARSRAGFSTRIPATVKVKVTAGGNIKIVAGGPNAPEAAPLENKGRAGVFRHPVFGQRENWVEQPARPFLAPAFDAHKERVVAEVEAAVYAAVLRAIRGR